MGGTVIFLGVFLWFAMAFNGGIGSVFVNWAAFASGLSMVAAGTAYIARWGAVYTRVLGVCALGGYLPVVWQRFHMRYGPDWVGLVFDGVYVVCLLAVIVRGKAAKPDRSMDSGVY